MSDGGQIASAVLGAALELAAKAPDTFRALFGVATVEELLERARVAGVALPIRTGADGTWEVDLAARIAGGEDPE